MRSPSIGALVLVCGALGCGADARVQVDWPDAVELVVVELADDDRVVRVFARGHTPDGDTRWDADDETRTVVLGFTRPLVSYGIDASVLGTYRGAAESAPLPVPEHALIRDGPRDTVDLEPSADEVDRAREAVRVPRSPCSTVRPVPDQPSLAWDATHAIELAVPYAPRSAIVGTIVSEGGSGLRIERVVGGTRTPLEVAYPEPVRVQRAHGFAEPDGTVWIIASSTQPFGTLLCSVSAAAARGTCAWMQGQVHVSLSEAFGARWHGKLEVWGLAKSGELIHAVEGAAGAPMSWRPVLAPLGGAECSLVSPVLQVLGAGRVAVARPDGSLEEVVVVEGEGPRRRILYETPTFMPGNCIGAFARLDHGLELLARLRVTEFSLMTIPLDVAWRWDAEQQWPLLAGLDALSQFPSLSVVGDRLVLASNVAVVVAPDPLRRDLAPQVCGTTDAIGGTVRVLRSWGDELMIFSGDAFGTTLRLGWYTVAR